MSILLSDEDKFYVGMGVTKGGGDYADIYEVIEASAKAQLKKVLGLLKSKNMAQPSPYRGLRLSREDWQALLKEIE